MAQIRDPIHGSIDVTRAELALIDSPYFQRLRTIKQLGFGELAFPGATHTRYAHSMGAMHLASRLMDAVGKQWEGNADDWARMCQAVRLAILFHDLGHAPLSHASEATMPPIKELPLPDWTHDASKADQQATHEHYTLAILLETDVADRIRKHFGDQGITPEWVASLIAGRPAPGPNPFVSGGIDYRPLLSQIVSGELDADRMDYLLRDSFYTGANYGRYDLAWIIQNVQSAIVDNAAHMAIDRKAIFAFEDFLLSRYHMFLSVYFHYSPICFDQMLRNYYAEAPDEYQLPSDPEAYLAHDDIHLVGVLRSSSNRWAKAIVTRNGWKLVAETNQFDKDYDLDALGQRLEDAGIETFRASRRSILSKYFKKGGPTLYVNDEGRGRLTPVQEYTELYTRYGQSMELDRLYCDPSRFEDAKAIVDGVLKGAA